MHGITQGGQGRIGLLHCLCENGLAGNLRRVGMYEVGTTTTYHNAVRIGIGFDGRDGLRKPVQRETDVNDTYQLTLPVLDGLTIAGYHLAGVGAHVEVHIWFRPARFIQQLWHEIPINIKVLVVVAATLDSAQRVTDILGVSREVASLVLEVVWFESDRAVVEVGVVHQHTTTVDEHRVGFVRMALHKPFSHIRGHLYTVQDAFHA